MTIRVKARSGESAEQILRRFKKMCEKEGLTKDIKRQAYYEKPSERRRRAMRKNDQAGHHAHDAPRASRAAPHALVRGQGRSCTFP